MTLSSKILSRNSTLKILETVQEVQDVRGFIFYDQVFFCTILWSHGVIMCSRMSR